MLKLIAPKRGTDSWGSGAFHASRDGDKRLHEGIDYDAPPGSIVLSHTAGKVTKHGYPYSDDLNFRYIEVTDGMGNRWRYFYVLPSIDVGAQICADSKLGVVQDIRPRYKGISNHVHLEVKDHVGNYLNPELVK